MQSLAVAQRAKPKPVKVRPERTVTRAPKVPRTKKELEARLDKLNRELVFWRDANTCCEKASDGAHCGGGLELGHIIRRADSAWLKRLFWNLTIQCHDHNVFHGDPQLWEVIGSQRMAALREAMVAHRNEAPKAEELQRRIEEVETLLKFRPVTWNYDLLVQLGYYGPL